jgi:hypothetical protein
MNPRAVPCQLLLSFARMSAIAASVVFVLPAPVGGASIAVTPHNCVFDGKAYGDLESLARALPVHEGEALSFEACVPGSTGLLTAVVQRFADRPLTISVFDASTPACSVAAPAVIPVVYRGIADAGMGGFVPGSTNYPTYETGYPELGYTYNSSGQLVEARNAGTVSGVEAERYWRNLAP